MNDVDDPLLRDRLRHLSGLGPMPFPSALAVLTPGWAQELHRAFIEFSFVERGDEGPVAYLQTWQLNGLRAPRCQNPRTVRLRSDASSWQRSITDLWDDRLDLRLPLDIVWVDPSPLNSQMQSYIGHVILLQEGQEAHAALLLTAIRHGVGPIEPNHVAICAADRVSASDVVDLFPIPGTLLRAPTMIRRDRLIWPARRSVRVSNGDNIVIEIQAVPPTVATSPATASAPSDSIALLQTKVQSVQKTHTFSVHARERLTADVVAHAQRPRQDMETSVRSPPDAPARPLHLHDLLEPPSWTTVDCSRVHYLRNQLLDRCSLSSCLEVYDDWCPASTSEILTETWPWTFEAPIQFDFYTDGSFLSAKSIAAAGAVLVVQTQAGLRFGGFQTSACLLPPSAPRAEATAVLLSLQWACALITQCGYDRVPIVFHFDSVYAGHAAQGRCLSVLNQDLTQIVRSFALWLEQLTFVKLEWMHVRGHSGNPWNDLADAISVRAARNAIVTTVLHELENECTFQSTDSHSVQWLWLYERSLQGRPDAPLLQGLSWKFNTRAPAHSTPDVSVQPWMQRLQRQQAKPVASASLQIRFATANVLTLYPAQQGASSFLGARAESLAMQFHREGVQCIGLQETRCSCSGYLAFDSFHVLSASADKGHGGVQLWLAKKVKTSSADIDITHSHLRIIHGDSRRLIVHLRHDHLRLLFIVLHAPCHEDAAALTAWWNATSALIPSSFSSWTWIVLCDANSRLGSLESACVGSFGAEEENLKGATFHEWLQRHDLWLPQTFESSHSGPHATWTHAAQGTGRLDYVGLSSNVPAEHACTWVEPQIDLTLVRPDHACVCADVTLPVRSPGSVFQAPSCSTPLRPPIWHDDVHTHAALLQAQLVSAHPSVPRDHLRKKHLTDETHALIRRKRRLLNRVRHARASWRRFCLQRIFAAFRAPDTIQFDDRRAVATLFQNIALADACYREASLQVCFAVRKDDRIFFQDLAEDTGRVARQGVHRIWDAIKPLLPKWKNRRLHNLRCLGPTADEQADHYCQLEGGVAIAYVDLLHDCHVAQRGQVEDLPLTVQLSQLPSRIDVECRIQQISANKAPGVDGIKPGVLRAEGSTISDETGQLILKMWLTGQEPVQFKGGLIHSISKKIHSTQVSNMRGIMLIDVIGKIAHALLRKRFLPSLMSWRHPLQLGGFPRCSTLFATQYLRSFQERAKWLHMPSAVLFLDVKSAFHCMLRQLLLGNIETIPPCLREILIAADCDPAAIALEIQRTSMAFDRDVPYCEQRLLRDAHTFTWFGLAEGEATYRTSRGSRPGSPLADVAFNAMMVQVLHDLHAALSANSLLQMGFQHFAMPAPPVTWVDDVAIPIITTHSSDLERALVQVTEATVAVFRRHGLSLNFKASKTEAVVAFRGSDAAACRADLLVKRLGRISLPTFDFQMKCSASYEHLGAIFADDACMAKEIEHRKSRATKAYRLVRRSILCNRHVDTITRLKLFESLIIPIILHGAGNWGLLSKRQYDGLHACIMTWQRSIVNDGFWTPGQRTDFELQGHWRLPALSLRLAKLRLLYAFHCVQDGPRLLLDYITSVAHLKGSWFHALRLGLQWLSTMDADFCPVSLHSASVENIVDWLHAQHRDGPHRVRRLYKKALLQMHVLGDVFSLHKQLRDTLLQGGVVLQQNDAPSALTSTLLLDCSWCDRQFDTTQKLQVHLWTAHQIISDERRFVFSDTCLACNTCFWTAARMQQHLRHSRRDPDGCYAQLTWRYAPLQDSCAVNVPDELRLHARLPAVVVDTVAQSPFDRVATTRQDADAALLRAWQAAHFPAQLDSTVQRDVARFADDVLSQWHPAPCISTEEIIFQMASYVDEDDEKLWAMCVWAETMLVFRRFPHLPVRAFQCLRQEVIDLFLGSKLGRLLSWQWRMDRAFVPVADEDLGSHSLISPTHETVLDPVVFQIQCLSPVLQPVVSVPDCSRVPITVEDGQPTIWVLHLFSGRRRRGDCHFWMDCMEGVIPGYRVRILSVDTAVDGVLGNLDRGLMFTRLLNIVRKKTFASGLTGPPCETFSAARHIVLDGGRHPRPLRSALHPWLLACRTGRELFQVLIGTRLLFHSMIVEAALVLSGAGSLMEHPAPHSDQDRASVWRTSFHGRWMMMLPDAHEHQIEQWKFGSKGVKPTTLRALNMGPPELVQGILHSHEDPLALRPCQPLKGRAADGSFRTAAAKEYPKLLCRALVHATLASIRHRLDQYGSVESEPLSAEEDHWMKTLYHASCHGDQRNSFLPDFQG
eukprot:s2283_g2.t1